MRILTLRLVFLSIFFGAEACIARSAANCNATTCGACLGKEGCGWCASTSSCVPGSALGPFAGGADAGLCPAGTYVFDSCPSSYTTGSCAQYSLSLSSSGSSGYGADTRIGVSNHVGSCGGDGAERVSSFSTTRSMDVRVETSQRMGGFPILYVREATCGGPEIVCNGSSTGAAITFRARAGVEYYVFLDTNTSGNGEYYAYEGSYRASEVTAVTPTCTAATALSSQQAIVVASSGATNGSCGGAGGERVFTYTPTSARTYVFSTSATSGDPVVYVRQGSCTGSEVGCNDDGGGSNNARLSLFLNSGTTYYVFADSYSSGASYTLNVQ